MKSTKSVFRKQPLTSTRSKQLRLVEIHLDGDTQPRTDINHALVDEYAELYSSGVALPPIDVFFDGAKFWLADGFHRWWAARKAGHTTIACQIHQGMLADAQWYSYAANRDHGLRRSTDDKAKAVKAALRHSTGAKMSDQDIAGHVGVDAKTVGKYRRKLVATLEIPESKERKGKDGRTTKTSRIGKRKTTSASSSPMTDEQIASTLGDDAGTLPNLSSALQFTGVDPDDPSYMVEIQPSVKYPGYYYLTTYEDLDTESGSIYYTRRPARLDKRLMAIVLQAQGKTPTCWTSEPAKPEEPWYTDDATYGKPARPRSPGADHDHADDQGAADDQEGDDHE